MGPATVLFDLDGTLVDSSPGITASIAHATAAAGVPTPDAAALRSLIGPPFPRAFVDVLGVDEATAEVMMTVYRDVYGRSGLYEVTVYPGIREALDALAAAGVPLAVTTSKPEPYAREVLRHVGLVDRFDRGVFGASLDGTVEGKAAVVALALAAHRGAPVRALVGDRSHDVEGAHAHGIPCVGVGWGFGDAGELAAADHVVDAPGGLVALLGTGPSTPASGTRSWR